MKSTTPTSILRDALLLAIVINSAGTGMVSAQETDEARTLDAITVTGSRISVPGVEASSPVAAVERAEFLTTQPVAVESFLKEFPALTPSVGAGTNNGTGGAATINMRGLGDNRTLVLIDGRRPVPFNLNNVVDTNTIPMSLLQSVEMLTGGASVVYGADAVAGVTNFILRRDFEGAEFNMNWGQSKYNDGTRQNYEATFGALSDDGRANAVLSIGFSKADPVRQGNRPWSVFSTGAVTGNRDGSATTVPGAFNVVGAGLGTLQINPETGFLQPLLPEARYNYNPLNYYQTALDRWQVTGLARYELNPHAEVYGQANYTRSFVGANWAPSGIFLTVMDVQLDNPFMPAGMRGQICSALNIAQANCETGRNAAGERIITPMAIGRRVTEPGPRLYDFTTRTFQTTVGVRGLLAGDWNYDGYWSYGESDQVHSIGNTVSVGNFRQAMMVDETGTACLDPSNGCVPMNPFGAEGSLTQEQLDFIRLTIFRMQRVEQTNAAFNLDGTLGDFKSPWADYPVGIAAGLEYRRTLGAVQYDEAWILNAAGAANSAGSFTIKEGYVESIIPLVNARPGVDNLSLELGYRYSDFSNAGGFGNEYGSWKYGLSWSPMDSLKLRIMQQRATRAPNITELFLPEVTAGNRMIADPCARGAINQTEALIPNTLSWLCVQTGVPLSEAGIMSHPSAAEVNVLQSGNLQLRPEEADTTTLGLVWTPNDNVSVTLDWWNIEINRAISSPTVQDVTSGCYDPAFNPGYVINEMCQLMNRNPANGTFNGIQARGIALLLSNQGFIQKTGIDLGLRLGHDLPGTLGRMQYALDLSKVTKDDFQAAPGAIVRDCLGYYSISCTPSHDVRSNFRATWAVADVNVTLAWRYFSAMDVEPLTEAELGKLDPPVSQYFGPYRHIASYSYFDLGMSYNAPWNARISLSVSNVLDKKPPLVGGDMGTTDKNSGNTWPQWYDTLGRYYNIGISFRF